MALMTVRNLKDIPEWDKSRIQFALTGGNRILAHPRFREELLKAKLTETQVNGVGPALTNHQVYARIVAGDQLHPLDNKDELDIEVILYRKTFSKVVGYTFTNSTTIWVNRKYFGKPKSIFSNLLHEGGGHQMGFLHNGRWATAVPYVLNQIAEKLWDELCQDIDREYEIWWNS